MKELIIGYCDNDRQQKDEIIKNLEFPLILNWVKAHWDSGKFAGWGEWNAFINTEHDLFTLIENREYRILSQDNCGGRQAVLRFFFPNEAEAKNYNFPIYNS